MARAPGGPLGAVGARPTAVGMSEPRKRARVGRDEARPGESHEAAELTARIGLLMHQLQRERGLMTLHVADNSWGGRRVSAASRDFGARAPSVGYARRFRRRRRAVGRRSLVKQQGCTAKVWTELRQWLVKVSRTPETKKGGDKAQSVIDRLSRAYADGGGHRKAEAEGDGSWSGGDGSWSSSWGNAVVDLEAKMGQMEGDLESIRELAVEGDIDRRRYADVARSYSVVLRRLLELHGSAVLARSRSPVLGFIHMLLRLKEYAGLQRALTTGMLAFKLVPPAVKDPVLKSHKSTGTIATLESNESSESSTSQKRPELPGRDELRAAIAIFSELKSQCVALRPTFLDVSEDPPAETNDDRDRLRRQVRAILGAKNFEAATRAPEDVVSGAGQACDIGQLQRRSSLGRFPLVSADFSTSDHGLGTVSKHER